MQTTLTGQLWSIALVTLILLPLPATAATRIANEPGLSGYAGLGVNLIRVKSNLIAGDTGTDEIDDLDGSAGRNTDYGFSPTLSLTYTFDNLNTEIFLGNSIEDFIRLDLTTAVGLRHQLNDVGIFEVVALTSPSPTEIYANPYLTGTDRDDTERTANGIRFEWGAILGSGFDLRFSQRESELDDENSGDSLVAADIISLVEQELLDRNGDIDTTTLFYTWKGDKGESLTLAGSYQQQDFDGDAMANDGYSLQVTDVRILGPQTRLVTNLLIGSFEHDDENPVFGETNEKQLVALAFSLFYREPFGAKNWLLNSTVAWAEENNSIDFYDTEVSFLNVGFLYQF